MEIDKEENGLTTKEALYKLFREIEFVLHQFKSSQKLRKSKSWVRDTLHHSSQHTTINWISGSFLLWTGISLILLYMFDNTNTMYIYESAFIIILLVLNVAIELYDNKLRHNEIPKKIQKILDKLKRETNKIVWSPENYPNLCLPFSPCITLQWTYRDNRLVNLPWSLLVQDDVILVRPGQISPGYCEALDKQSDVPLLHSKEVFAPSIQNANEIFSTPKARKPLECKKYRLLETPYLNNLKIILEQALDRPITQHNQQRHLLMIKIIERFFLPITFIAIYIINLFRYFYKNRYLRHDTEYNMFLMIPTTTILPLLPIAFPIAWNLLNYFGIARFKTIFDATRNVEKQQNALEEDTENTTIDITELKYTHTDICNNFLDILKGKPEIIARTANILHVLGSVTALCCVDKKGILSWPNPTAEKVFFLHNNDNISPSSSLGNVGDLTNDVDSSQSTPHHVFHPESPNTAIAEVLDLTHNHSEPFKLHFDDQEWHRHLSSLKPLGLAILLNTCNLDTQKHYSEFCSHITCEAMYNENLVPVTNRRCLCELAKEIGFVDQAQKIFTLEQQLSTFRHLQPEMVRRDNKYARSLQLSTKLKFPFPHMFAVVVKELSSGSMQLLSEGTADIILDSCVDYWDGHDLCPLSNSDKKKIQDFYQRSSLTAYCTAFAYRPLNKCLNNKLNDVYLELPSDSRHLYMNHRSPTPIHWECKSILEPKIKTPIGQFFSTDSLLYNDYPSVDVSDAEGCFQMQCNQVFIGMVTMQYQALTDMVQLIEQLERACIRFVHFSKENELRSRVFSEKMGLESGWNCHISLLSDRNRDNRETGKECIDNPGLQSDMNRRLSQSVRRLPTSTPMNDEKSYFLHYNSNLASSRTMSFSAPSAINMEHSTVKFDTEVEKSNRNSSEQSNVYDPKTMSHDSVQTHTELNSTTHEWQSLSCLTDSTEQSAPINFDMSNRAKLPRGIDKIRPHIELIDNVPLLVSLFTDCTSCAIREMLNIMQDYGEVVCVMGSSANCENTGIFMQSDASIAVDPLFPQMCQKYEVYEPSKIISPTDLASELNSIACSLYVKREEPISFYHLVMESRHYMKTLWSSVQFWLCCCIMLTLTQVTATMLMLPSILTPGQVLWFCCIVIPFLSISLMGISVDPDVMKKPQGKNQIVFNMDVAVFILWCYGLKFMPTIIIVMISYTGILSNHCYELCMLHNCTCANFYTPVNKTNNLYIEGWTENNWTLVNARLIIVFIILLHFVVISIGFVHREYLIFKKSPHNNFYWLTIIFTLVIIQSIYTIVYFNIIKHRFDDEVQFQIPIWILIFASLSPFIVFIVNELVKHHEIKVNDRFQKRARLDFGTKLGMNSPF